MTENESGHWRAVWRVPPHVTGWRSALDHLKDDEYLGTNEWPTQDACEKRGKSDQEKFDDIGFPEGVQFLRAQFFPA